MTTNFFDAMGRIWKTTLPDNTSLTNKYDLNGMVTNTSGSRTYPVAYTYDSQNRMKTMTTWTNFAGKSGAATTTWNYDGYRGWLSSKVYADNHYVYYTYTAAGRLYRGPGLGASPRSTHTTTPGTCPASATATVLPPHQLRL